MTYKNKFQGKAEMLGLAAALLSLPAGYCQTARASTPASVPELGSVYQPSEQYRLGMQLLNRQNKSRHDVDQGIRWLQLAAAHRNPDALFQLGMFHENGFDNVEKDVRRAIRFYEQAADLGNREAIYNLTALVLKKNTDYYDPDTALYWLQRGAHRGDANIQFSLAMFYRDQQQNSRKSLQWLFKSAWNGHKSAQYVLGTYFLQGRYLPRDPRKSFQWFEMAAKAGDAMSQYDVALMYETGEGAPANQNMAVYWYEQA
ncbi:MAG TPA: tetratricopeptide repeat protein, partial [Thiolinea sp.]|nr:tetratricopeptide repeat protein [Thiolinea sp.]